MCFNDGDGDYDDDGDDDDDGGDDDGGDDEGGDDDDDGGDDGDDADDDADGDDGDDDDADDDDGDDDDEEEVVEEEEQEQEQEERKMMRGRWWCWGWGGGGWCWGGGCWGGWCWGGRPIPRRGSTLYASLRSPNAHGHFTRAILCGNLRGKCQTPWIPTSIEHRALTLTVRTPQCGHTVWGNMLVIGDHDPISMVEKNPHVWNHQKKYGDMIVRNMYGIIWDN